MSAKDPQGRKAGEGKGGEGKAGQGGKGIHSCGMTSDALQRGFDGEGGAQDVASHVAGCDPCGSALELLQTQRDAVQFLTASAAVTAPHTAVEQILSSTARAGRAKLADLLYEMAKACLIVLPDLKRRIERKVEPREVPVVASELQSINSRLEMTDGAIALRDVPSAEPTASRSLWVAQRCLAILENVEGRSERQRLVQSQVLIFDGQPALAEELLRDLLTSIETLDHRELVQRDAMLSLLLQHKFQEATDFGATVLSERPEDPCILYNMAVSLAWLGKRDEFEQIGNRIAKQIVGGEPRWLVDAIHDQVPKLAGALGTSFDSIAISLGLDKQGRNK